MALNERYHVVVSLKSISVKNFVVWTSIADVHGWLKSLTGNAQSVSEPNRFTTHSQPNPIINSDVQVTLIFEGSAPRLLCGWSDPVFRGFQVAIVALAVCQSVCVHPLDKPSNLVPHGFVASLTFFPHA